MLMETDLPWAHEELGQQRHIVTCTAGLLHPSLADYLMVILMAGPTISSEVCGKHCLPLSSSPVPKTLGAQVSENPVL